MKRFLIVATGLLAAGASQAPAYAQSSDPFLGRRLAEETCSACHQVAADIPSKNPTSGAPSFVDVSRMPSTTELSIKVFLRSSHPTMPNILLTSEEIDSVAAYIVSLTKK